MRCCSSLSLQPSRSRARDLGHLTLRRPRDSSPHVELRTFRTALHEVVRRRLSDIGGRTAAPRTLGFDELARLPLRAVGARGNVDP